MGNFRNLTVWQKSRELTNSIYLATKLFPDEERFGLTAQLRRASVSVMSNLAEGCGRNRTTELLRFLDIAGGSATEIECQLVVAEDQGYLSAKGATSLQRRVKEVQRMLAGLIRHLKSTSS